MANKDTHPKFLDKTGAKHVVDKVKELMPGYNIPTQKMTPNNPDSTRILLLGDIVDDNGDSVFKEGSHNDADVVIKIPSKTTDGYSPFSITKNWDWGANGVSHGFIQIPAMYDSSSQHLVIANYGNIDVVGAGSINITNGNALINFSNSGNINILTYETNKVNIGTFEHPENISVSKDNVDINALHCNVYGELRAGVEERDGGTGNPSIKATHYDVSLFVRDKFGGQGGKLPRYYFSHDTFKFRLHEDFECSYSIENGYRFKHSASSSFRLNDDGMTVYTTLKAKADNCPDIDDYTDAEKAILNNNSVQKNILRHHRDISEISPKVFDMGDYPFYLMEEGEAFNLEDVYSPNLFERVMWDFGDLKTSNIIFRSEGINFHPIQSWKMGSDVLMIFNVMDPHRAMDTKDQYMLIAMSAYAGGVILYRMEGLK